MLNTVERSRANKTAGLAVTYRAEPGAMYGTCPDSCPLKPVETATREIDREYEAALRESLPRRGSAFLFTHFPPALWAKRNTRGPDREATFNYSAPDLATAAQSIRDGDAAVAVVPHDFWDGRPTRHVVLVDGTPGVRCPAETGKVSGCTGCGAGLPLCARPRRHYFIIFTAHGAAKRKAGDNAQPGGCYGSGGNVALHWRDLVSRREPVASDADTHRRFVRRLAPGTIVRPHIVGDMGLAPPRN